MDLETLGSDYMQRKISICWKRQSKIILVNYTLKQMFVCCKQMRTSKSFYCFSIHFFNSAQVFLNHIFKINFKEA